MSAEHLQLLEAESIPSLREVAAAERRARFGHDAALVTIYGPADLVSTAAQAVLRALKHAGITE